MFNLLSLYYYIIVIVIVNNIIIWFLFASPARMETQTL